jgi:hypothetical protein
MCSSNLPSGSTGLTTGSPYSRLMAMSSAPKAGAICTSPVPSAVVTNEPVTTRCACGISIKRSGGS